MIEQIEYVLEIIALNVGNFLEFTRRDFDAFFAIYLVILGITVLISILMLFNQIVKWIQGDKDGIRQR
jgi:hypothetical protein